METLLTADFGSTYTKLTAIDLESASILGTAKAFTTIETSLIEGFQGAKAELKKQTGLSLYSRTMASSSAAGGLRMVSVGLVPKLSSQVARLAACSAGAKIIGTYSYELSQGELEEIGQAKPDLILLSGGIDGGNKEVLLQNAQALSTLGGEFAVIVAGNKAVSAQAGEIFRQGGKEVVVTENVMPDFERINTAPAKEAIRRLFISRIIEAKGLREVQAQVDQEIIPTPLAVFEACENFARKGGLVAVDIGGATTDVYSLWEGTPAAGVVAKGIPEPYAKRTVEGDLGVRYSLDSLTQGWEMETSLRSWVARCRQNPAAVPGSKEEEQGDLHLASRCIELGLSRHCGVLEESYTPLGKMRVQTGKDLRKVAYFLGTGGSLIHSRTPGEIFRRGLYKPEDPLLLKPENPCFLVDKDYILAAMGLLGRVSKEKALKIMEKQFLEVE